MSFMIIMPRKLPCLNEMRGGLRKHSTSLALYLQTVCIVQLLCVARKPLAHHRKKKKYHVTTCAPAAYRRLDRGAPGLSGSPFIKSALSNWALPV